jgi:2Fe-2S ferredoxin
MAKVIVVGESGEERVIDGECGRSLMQIMRDNGMDELQALCGGACACATCHVWVDPACVERLPPMSGQEDDMLECVAERRANSRLSCQVVMSDALDGIRVQIAPI